MQMKNKNETSNREWKSSAFTTYFGTPERAAELYRALEHDEEIGPEDIEFATLEGVLFMARKNDMAFTVRKKVLVIGEHQSTINQNMPLRNTIYYGRTMEKLIPAKDIYKTKKIYIPTPEFYVFYNGVAPQPPEQILSLSDSYLVMTDDPMLQLKTKVININLPVNHEILQKSRAVYEYSWFVQRIRDYLIKGLGRDEAVALAIKDCLGEGIMTDFIREHGSEVENMLFTEFNLDDALEVRYEEGKMDGNLEGSMKMLIRQVIKKIQKGKEHQQITEELEADEMLIQDICEAATACGLNCEDIYDWMEKHNKFARLTCQN